MIVCSVDSLRLPGGVDHHFPALLDSCSRHSVCLSNAGLLMVASASIRELPHSQKLRIFHDRFSLQLLVYFVYENIFWLSSVKRTSGMTDALLGAS